MPLNIPPVEYADISQWQTSFDPGAYFAAGYGKVSIRATYGTNGVDPLFPSRWEASAGHTRQSYHFAYPGDGKGEADWHLARVAAAGGYHPGDEVMLDLEQLGVTPEQAGQIAPRFMADIAAAQPGVRRFVYGNEWFIAAAGLTPANLPNVGLAIAAYPGPPDVPPGWDHVCVHQYADNASVPGFPAPVDINRIVCPSGLSHLTYGDDMSQADIDAINAHTDQQLGNLATLLAARFDRGDAADKQIAQALTTIYGPQKSDGTGPVDGTHKGVGDVYRLIQTLPAGMASAAVAAVEQYVPAGTTVDQAALETAVAAAIEKQLSGAIITLTPKATS